LDKDGRIDVNLLQQLQERAWKIEEQINEMTGECIFDSNPPGFDFSDAERFFEGE